MYNTRNTLNAAVPNSMNVPTESKSPAPRNQNTLRRRRPASTASHVRHARHGYTIDHEPGNNTADGTITHKAAADKPARLPKRSFASLNTHHTVSIFANSGSSMPAKALAK